MEILENLQADLINIEKMLEQAKSQVYQYVGIKRYIEGKITEFKKVSEEKVVSSKEDEGERS